MTLFRSDTTNGDDGDNYDDDVVDGHRHHRQHHQHNHCQHYHRRIPSHGKEYHHQYNKYDENHGNDNREHCKDQGVEQDDEGGGGESHYQYHEHDENDEGVGDKIINHNNDYNHYNGFNDNHHQDNDDTRHAKRFDNAQKKHDWHASECYSSLADDSDNEEEDARRRSGGLLHDRLKFRQEHHCRGHSKGTADNENNDNCYDNEVEEEDWYGVNDAHALLEPPQQQRWHQQQQENELQQQQRPLLLQDDQEEDDVPLRYICVDGIMNDDSDQDDDNQTWLDSHDRRQHSQHQNKNQQQQQQYSNRNHSRDADDDDGYNRNHRDRDESSSSSSLSRDDFEPRMNDGISHTDDNNRNYGNYGVHNHPRQQEDHSVVEDEEDRRNNNIKSRNSNTHRNKSSRSNVNNTFLFSTLDVIQRIESVVVNLLEYLNHNQGPILTSYVQDSNPNDNDSDSCEQDSYTGRQPHHQQQQQSRLALPLPTASTPNFHRSFANISQSRSFASILLVLSFIHSLLLSNRTTTTREVYYVFVTHFRGQRECDGVILDVVKILGVPRRSLGLSASPKGEFISWLVGWLVGWFGFLLSSFVCMSQYFTKNT